MASRKEDKGKEATIALALVIAKVEEPVKNIPKNQKKQNQTVQTNVTKSGQKSGGGKNK